MYFPVPSRIFNQLARWKAIRTRHWSNSSRIYSVRRQNSTCLKNINLFILFWIRENCFISGKTLIILHIYKQDDRPNYNN